MSATRPRPIVARTLFLGLFCGISAACSGLLGLEELPLRPAADASPTAVPSDAPTTPPLPEASVPDADAGEDVDAAKPPCDPTKLDDDPNNCGACGKVCRSRCTAKVCDADELGNYPGVPSGLFVAGDSAYFAVGEGSRTRLLSCPVAGPCLVPTEVRVDAVQKIRLLAAKPSTPARLTFWLFDSVAQKNSFFTCEAGACTGTSPFKVEFGVAVDDMIDAENGSGHWVAFTTGIAAVVQNVAGGVSPVHSSMSKAQLLGSNDTYVWGRKGSTIYRLTLGSSAVPATSGLDTLPSALEVLGNGGAGTIVPATNSRILTCTGPDCAATTPCTADVKGVFFGVDGTHVGYLNNAGIALATFAAPCTVEKTITPATPVGNSYGRSIALAPAHVLWLEERGARTHLFRAPR